MKYSIRILIAILAVGQIPTLVSAQQSLTLVEKTKVDPLGTWRREYDWYDTRIVEVFQLKVNEDAKFIGTMWRNEAISKINNAKLKGHELSFSVSNDYQGTTWTTIYTGTINGDDINGKVVLQVGDRSWDWPWPTFRQNHP